MGVLLMGTLLLVGHSVLAASSSVVVLGTGTYPGLAQMRAELSALEIRAILLDTASTGSVPGRLAQVARDWGTTVAIEFVSAPDELQVWLYDARTGEPPRMQSFPRDRGGVESARVEALRVAEFLRAALTKATPRPAVGSPARKSAKARKRREKERNHWYLPSDDYEVGESATSEPEEAPETEPLQGVPSLWLSYSSGLLFNSGSSLAVESTLGVMWQPNRQFALELRAMLPVSSARLSGAVGAAEYHTWGIGAGARYSFKGLDSHWLPMAAAGVSFLAFPVGGAQASLGYEVARTETLQVIAPHVEFGLLWQVRQWFSVCPLLWAAYTIPEPIVRFAGRDIARLGRPLLFFSIRVEWRAIDWGWSD